MLITRLGIKEQKPKQKTPAEMLLDIARPKPVLKPKPKVVEPEGITTIKKAVRATVENEKNPEVKAARERVRTVSIKTKYGTTTTEQKGWDMLTLEERQAKLRELRAEAEEAFDKATPKDKQPAKTYDPLNEPVDNRSIEDRTRENIRNFVGMGLAAGGASTTGIRDYENFVQNNKDGVGALLSSPTDLVMASGRVGENINPFKNTIGQNIDLATGVLELGGAVGGVTQLPAMGARLGAKLTGKAGTNILRTGAKGLANDVRIGDDIARVGRMGGASSVGDIDAGLTHAFRPKVPTVEPQKLPDVEFRPKKENPFLPPTATKEPNPFLPPSKSDDISEAVPIDADLGVDALPKSGPITITAKSGMKVEHSTFDDVMSTFGDSDSGYAGMGLYGAPTSIASRYSDKPGRTLKTLTFRFQNPLVRTAENWKSPDMPYDWIPKRTSELESQGLTWEAAKLQASREYPEFLKSKGYDGFIDAASGDGKLGEIVAYDKKSVTIETPDAPKQINETKSEPTNPFLPPTKVDAPVTKPTMVEEVIESVDDGQTIQDIERQIEQIRERSAFEFGDTALASQNEMIDLYNKLDGIKAGRSVEAGESRRVNDDWDEDGNWGDENDFDDEFRLDEGAADDLAKSAGIHIYSNRNLKNVIKDDNGKGIGALWTHADDDSYTFDVVVDPAHQRAGHATRLVKEAIADYNEMLDAYPDMKLEAYVVSPEMKSLLENKFGWEVVDGSDGRWNMAPPDKPVKAKTPEPPVAKPKAEVADMEPKTTGISNAANEADVEMGLLDNAPEGKGRKATEIYEQNRTREDYQDVAKRIADGEALTADNIATVLAGNQKITKRVTDARLALKEGIDAGLPDAKVRELQRAYDQAKVDKMEFLENVQKGKSEWSNIGRVLAKRTDIDTGDIAQVLEEARLQKGRDLTDTEVEQWQKVVDDHKATISALEARLDAVLRGRKDAISDTGILRRIGKGKEGIRAERTLARSDLLKVLSRTSGIIPGGGDPEAVIELYKYLKTFIAEGVEGIDDLLKKAKADLADTDAAHIDREDIVQALTKKPVARKLSELQDSLKKLRAEAKALSEPEPKPKVNNAEYNKRVREYARTGRAGDAEVKAKINRTTELEKEIKEIQELIAKGEYFENQPKKLREVDKEVYALELKRKYEKDKLNSMLQDLKPKSRSERIATGLNSWNIINLASRLIDTLSNTGRAISNVKNLPAEWIVDKASAKYLNETPLIVHNKGFATERVARTADRVKTGVPDQFRRVWKGVDKASKDKLGTGGGGGIGGKLAGSSDAAFYVGHKERAIDMFADTRARQVLGKGAKQADVADMRDSIIRDIENHPDIAMQAEEYALFQTFNNNNVLTKIANAVKGPVPDAGKALLDILLFRYGKVLTNVATDTFDRVGFGLIRGGTKLAIAKTAGKSLSMADQAIINDMIAKGLVGMATMYTGKVLEDKYQLTEKLGIGKIKGERVKYLDFGDAQNLGGDMAIMLLGATISRASKMENPEEGKALIMATFGKMPFNNPTTTSADDILDALNEGNITAVNKYLAKKLTNTLMPGQLRDIGNRSDIPFPWLKTGNEPEREKVPKEINPRTNKERQTGDFLKILQGEAMSKTPILRQRLPVKKEKTPLIDPDKNKTKV